MPKNRYETAFSIFQNASSFKFFNIFSCRIFPEALDNILINQLWQILDIINFAIYEKSKLKQKNRFWIQVYILPRERRHVEKSCNSLYSIIPIKKRPIYPKF